MRKAFPMALAAALLAPGRALGGETYLDFTAPGPLKTYLELGMSVARSYLPLALLLAVALEAVAHAPGRPRDFAAVAWRFILVLFLLASYQRVFGFVLETTQDVADKLAPKNALLDYGAYLDTAYGLPSTIGGESPQQGSGASANASKASPFAPQGIIGDALMSLLLGLAQALVYAIEKLAHILAAVFFILGPLALVAGIPRQSGTAARWFHHFVTVACWPIFSAVLLGVMTAVAKQSAGRSVGSYLGSLVTALVMGLCALAAPLLSNWIVGGAAQNVVAAGASSFRGVSGPVSRAARTAAQGVRNWRAARGGADSSDAADSGVGRGLGSAPRSRRSKGAPQRSGGRGAPSANRPV